MLIYHGESGQSEHTLTLVKTAMKKYGNRRSLIPARMPAHYSLLQEGKGIQDHSIVGKLRVGLRLRRTTAAN